MDFDDLYNFMMPEEESLFAGSPFQSHSKTDTFLSPFADSDDCFNALSDNLSSTLLPLRCYHEPRFDDIDIDSFTWDDDNLKITNNTNHDSGGGVDNIPLVSDEEKVPQNQAAGSKPKLSELGLDEISKAGSKPKLSELGLDEISKYFSTTITKAAKEMNVGLTVLKKRCRELGIERWPHRKLKSLESLINNLKEFGMDAEQEKSVMLKTLEEQRRLMEENPAMEMNEWIKKKRQACFKANFKRRRGLL